MNWIWQINSVVSRPVSFNEFFFLLLFRSCISSYPEKTISSCDYKQPGPWPVPNRVDSGQLLSALFSSHDIKGHVTWGPKSQVPLVLASIGLVSPRETIKIWLDINKSGSWLFRTQILAGVVLKVGSSFLLDPIPNTSPELRLQKVLSCRYPCHTWDLGLGTPCDPTLSYSWVLDGSYISRTPSSQPLVDGIRVGFNNSVRAQTRVQINIKQLCWSRANFLH